MQISFEEVLNKRTKKQASITNLNQKRLKPGIANFNNLFAQKRKSLVTTIIGSGVVVSEDRQMPCRRIPSS
jgi:predicted amidohydrolase